MASTTAGQRPRSKRFLPPSKSVEEPYRPDSRLLRRVSVLGVAMLVIFAGLVLRLWALQILSGTTYVKQAAANSFRTVRVQAPRGEIVDRNGVPLVTNAPATAILLWPGDLPKVYTQRYAELREIAKVTSVPLYEIAAGIKARRDANDLVTPVTVRESASDSMVYYLYEHSAQFPGVTTWRTFIRHYPYHSLAAQVLGYVGEISPTELAARTKQDYKPGDEIGQSGVESTYDSYLRGVPGTARLHIDALGRPRSSLATTTIAKPGNNVRLTIDSRLQTAAEKALQYGIGLAQANKQWYAHGGAIVALDPNDGSILALASSPSYDPSVFLPPAKNASRLYKDKYNQPLIDKTLEPKAPGSTFKPITATAAWNSGVLGPGSTLDCPGVFYRPGDFSHTPFPNWTTVSLGTMDLQTALEQSCNTFFFQLGSRMYDLPNQGIAFQKTIRQYGFGKTPPMDLPVSPYFSGLVPDPAWRLQTYSKPIDQVWQPGYDIQMAIGQGDLTVSPMQLAVAYSAIANGGKLVMPHIGKALLDSQGKVVKRFDPRPQRDLNLSPTLLSEIRQGLYEASHSSLGTSSSVFGGYTPAVAGKTGTAEHPPDPSPNAWFASFAPADNPRLVVVALINDGGHGGVSAAPAARQVYQGFFHQKITNTVGTDSSR